MKDSAAPCSRTVAPTTQQLVQVLRRAMRACAGVLWTTLALLAPADAAFGMSGIEAAMTLGDLRELHRFSAIHSLVWNGQISRPLSAADGAIILQGTTQSPRSSSIHALAPLFRADLSGAEAATILGDDATLSEVHRFTAISALAWAGRLRAGLTGDEMALVLHGTSGSARRSSIGAIASATKRQTSARPSAGADPFVGGSPGTSGTAGTTPLSRGVQPPAAVVGAIGGTPAPSTTTGTTPASGSAPSAANVVPLPAVSNANMRAMANAYQFAQLSEAAYKTPGTVQTRGLAIDQTWNRVTASSGNSTGFTAAVYMNEAKAICAIAFAGTNQAADWVSNISNVVGLQIGQYQQALAFAGAAVSGVCARKNIALTGHSLGGGLAQYVYVKSGQKFPTYTFNPAGISATNPDFQFINLDATHVLNFIALSYSSQTGQPVGMEPVSLSGVTLGREISVPVFGSTGATHGIDVIREALGVYRDRCRVDPTCR